MQLALMVLESGSDIKVPEFRKYTKKAANLSASANATHVSHSSPRVKPKPNSTLYYFELDAAILKELGCGEPLCCWDLSDRLLVKANVELVNTTRRRMRTRVTAMLERMRIRGEVISKMGKGASDLSWMVCPITR